MTDPVLANYDGFWWPAMDTDARGVITRDCLPSIAKLLPYITGRDCIVQAGANVGLYPVALTDHFQSVMTCEPDPTNYACLVRNLKARDSLQRVTALHAAFGETEGGCTPLEVQPRNCGAHRVNFAKGEVPVWTIDGLNLDACDAIWLDIEGSELLALKGARQTIEQFWPVIACEDKGLGDAYGISRADLHGWLEGLGYAQVDRIGQDSVFTRTA